MFGISGTELLLIGVFVLIIFGPDKLPELARTFGKAMRMFKTAQEDMEKVIRAEVYPENPLSALNDSSATETKPAAGVAPPQPATPAAESIWSDDDEDEEEEE